MKVFTLPDGRALAYRETGSGPPLILLHGWGMSSAVFAEMTGSLGRRFRVLVPDLPGHGASTARMGFGFADVAADLQLWIETLDLTRAAVLGWSMGGQVLLELYPLVARRTEQVVFVATTPHFVETVDWAPGLPAGQIRALQRNLQRNYERTLGDFFALQFAGEELSRERYRQIVTFAVRSGSLPVPAVAAQALEALQIEDQRQRAARIACPALVLHGDLDAIVPVAAGAWLAAQLPRGRFVPLAGVGHAPFLSRPQETLALLRSFWS